MPRSLNDAEALENLRLLSLGFLSSVLHHELSNILTVVGGVRQTMAVGLGERIEGKFAEMIDNQMKRSEEISRVCQVVWAPSDSKPTPALLADCRSELSALLELRARGRRLRVLTGADANLPLSGEVAHPFRLAAIGASLAITEEIFFARIPSILTLGTEVDGDLARLSIQSVITKPSHTLTPMDPAPLCVTLAEQVLSAKGGTLELTCEGDRRELILAIPAKRN